MSLKKREYLRVCSLGGIGYGALELLWRGRTHWSMLIAGGLSFGFMYRISKARLGPHVKCLLSCSAVTAVEFVFGVIFNLLLGLRVWDYSNRRLHLAGQICPLYCLFWLLLSAPCMALSRALRRALRG